MSKEEEMIGWIALGFAVLASLPILVIVGTAVWESWEKELKEVWNWEWRGIGL